MTMMNNRFQKMEGRQVVDWTSKSYSIMLLLMWTLVAFECGPNLVISATVPSCYGADIPVARNLSDMYEDNYGRPGFSHMTIAGALYHGMKEVEVFLQTFAPGSSTPVHRHDCEEVFLAIRGQGTLFLAQPSDSLYPGTPDRLGLVVNTTLTIPVNAVHQIQNTHESIDLQVLVVISRPPMRLYVYMDWYMPHADAMLTPALWDAHCMDPKTQSEPGASGISHSEL